MKRRDFLRKAGMVGLGVVAAPAVVNALPRPKPKPKPYLIDPELFPNLNLVNNEIIVGDDRFLAEAIFEDYNHFHGKK